MLEGLAAWVLNTYIGEYLENLNTDQLSIGLLQGYAELENVPLKRTALRKFDVPLCVRAGVIGKLTLSVPLTRLRSEPWVVTVSDLYVVLEPDHHHYDMEFESQYSQEKKKMQLDGLEIAHKKRLADSVPSGSGADTAHAIDAQQPPSGSGWWAYGASFVSAIVENIQLIATNVHVRYEDNATIPGYAFACGVKIGRFSVQSANSNWEPGFVLRREGENRRKLVELNGFAIYWDTAEGVGLLKLMAPENYKDLMEKMRQIDTENTHHQYLLSPLGLRVKLEKNTSKIPLKSLPPSPRFKFDLVPDKVNVQGSRKQFMELRLMIDEWHRYQRGKPYRKWRPKAALTKETARQWWKFAIVCHLETIRQRNERCTWRYICGRARQVNAYCKAYIRMLGKSKEFTKSDEALMRQIEREYGFDELQLLREGALRYGLRTGQLARAQHPSTLPVPNDASFVRAASDLSNSSSASTTPVHSPRDERQQTAVSGSSTGYLASWLGYWWSGSGSGQSPQQQPSHLLYEPPQIMEPLRDDPALQEEIHKVEQVLEEELWDMYNETMDDSAIMGRDLLFAAVNLSMKSLNIAFAGGSTEGLPIDSNSSSGGVNEMHQCLSDASLDFGLRMKYLPVPESRNTVIPCFELSAKFGSGLNMCFNNKQYESVLQALAGWSGKIGSEESGQVHGDPRSRKASFGAEKQMSNSRRSSSAMLGKGPVVKRERKDRADYQLWADVEIPKLKIDLKTDFNVDVATTASDGQPLISILCDSLSIAYKKTKPHICVVETSMASFLALDLLEGSVKTPNLAKASGGIGDASAARLFNSFLSTSCPDISGDVKDETAAILSTSLPSATATVGSSISPSLKHFFPATPPSTPTERYDIRRRSEEAKWRRNETPASGKVSFPPSDGKKRRTEDQEQYGSQRPVRIMVTLVDSVHEDFNDGYKQVGTLINFEADDLEVVINEQTVIMLLDFLGMLTSESSKGISDHEKSIVDVNALLATSGSAGGKKVQMDMEVRTLKVAMNKPLEGYQLGNMAVDDLQACILIDEIGFSLNGQSSSFKLYDETPMYSRLYPERLNCVTNGDKNLQFLFYKYNRTDYELKREFDACLALYAEDGVQYVHTQRYLSDVINFWNHFAQVYDLYANAKAASLGYQKPESVSHGFRLKLRVDLRGTKLFLPISALDTPVVVAEMSRVVADNDFLFSSLLEEGRQSTSQGDYDCLVDVLQLHLEDVRLFEGLRVPDQGDEEFAVMSPSTNFIAKDKRRSVEFKDFTIMVNADSLTDRPISLDISVARNLDTSLARSVPDMKIHTSIDSVNLRLRVDTYAVIRAMLDHNLGEELPIQPSSASIAQITPACATNGPWTSFELTCDLNDVLVDCFTPDADSGSVPSNILCHLGRVDLERVKFSFESFSDGSRHIDLICNDARLIDTRFEGEAANKRDNVFSTIWGPSDSDVSGDRVGRKPKLRRSDKLLGEIHFASERNCSTLTLVFSKARLLFVTDWLQLAHNFLVTKAPVRKDTWKTAAGGTETSHKKRKMEKWKSQRGGLLAKTGVVTRAELEEMKKENFKLKATLLDSEAVFLERPSSRNSLAVVLKAKASLYFENVDDRMKFECRDSNLQIFDCVYGSKDETAIAVTNTFVFVAEFAALPKTTRTSKYLNLGLLETVPQIPEYRLKMTLGSLVAKSSYRDYLVLRAVWEAYAAQWAEPEAAPKVVRISKSLAEENRMVIDKVELKLESVSLCFLDDFQDTRFPLFKVAVNDGVIEYRPGKSSRDPQDGCGALLVEMSYFNQKVYGWEPFLESWRLNNLTWSYNANTNALNLEILGDKLLDVTVTKTFIQQTRHFLSSWPNLMEALSKDFRSRFAKRLDSQPSPADKTAMEISCSCTLNAGVGLSIVNDDSEELIYARLTGLILYARREKGKYTLGVKVLEIQADNQLWNAERWTLLHIRSKFDEKQDPTFLALDLLVQWTPLPSYDSFDTFVVSINKVALYVDEVLLWKLFLFFSNDPTTSAGMSMAGQQAIDRSSLEWTTLNLYQNSPSPNLELDRPDSKQARRCYFRILNLSCRRLYLSVVTASDLPPDIKRIKQMYNMPLIRFENASVEIAPFQKSYYFETLDFLLEALHQHFTQELKSQAVKILGTVDFLGNPVGLFRDVSDSLQELVIDANVPGFVTGLVHGFSNSTAKITSSLSDQVGKIAMDDVHRQLRESIKQSQSQSQDAMGHLLTGVKGLGIGVVGGMKSVIVQPVDGMKKDGFEGLFTGVVKGVVGMVTKPVQGVLDLATGVSNATREAVSGSDGPLTSRFPPCRLRFPRVARNLQGTLPPYSELLAVAQRTLLSINDGNLQELCLSMDVCCTLQQQTQVLVLISTTNAYFLRRRRAEDVRVLMNIAYSQLRGCTCVLENVTETHSQIPGLVTWQQPYLKFVLKTSDPQNSKRQIKCDSMEKATELCQKILYAKQQYEEQEQSLAIPENYCLDQI